MLASPTAARQTSDSRAARGRTEQMFATMRDAELVRSCDECGVALVQRYGEGARDWVARKFCGRPCFIANRKRTARVGPQPRSGRRGAPEYLAWGSIIQRCTNPKNENYATYGGRGISVCAEWRASYEAFLADVGRRPSAEHSIDRIDNDRGYEPGNVRWATSGVQARNTRSTRLITAFGKTQCLSDWATEIGVSVPALIGRLAKMPVEQALSLPPNYGRGA